MAKSNAKRNSKIRTGTTTGGCRRRGPSEQKWNAGPSKGPPTTWDKRLDELTKYKAQHGHCNVPARKGPLCNWVYNQRTLRKKGNLSKERVRKLNKLGFDWSPKSAQPTWEERFNELTEYKAEHGHSNVPPSQGPLGNWVKNQRAAHKGGKPWLSEERVQKLDALDFSWGTTRGTPSTWDVRLGELTEYKADHGRCNVPKSQGSLGRWVDHQRQAYKRGELSEERIQKLDALGFNWGASYFSWDETFENLKAVLEDENHDTIRKKWRAVNKDDRLRGWVIRQRSALLEDTLTTERAKKLLSIEFAWAGPISGRNKFVIGKQRLKTAQAIAKGEGMGGVGINVPTLDPKGDHGAVLTKLDEMIELMERMNLAAKDATV